MVGKLARNLYLHETCRRPVESSCQMKTACTPVVEIPAGPRPMLPIRLLASAAANQQLVGLMDGNKLMRCVWAVIQVWVAPVLIAGFSSIAAESRTTMAGGQEELTSAPACGMPA